MLASLTTPKFLTMLAITGFLLTHSAGMAQDTTNSPTAGESDFNTGFGTRGLGSRFSEGQRQQPGAGSTGALEAGQLDPTARFQRDNRSRNDFVGADRGETGGFVGSTQATDTGPGGSPVAGQFPAGQLPNSPQFGTLNPRSRLSRRINVPRRTSAPNARPEPPVVIGFAAPTRRPIEIEMGINNHLQQLPLLMMNGQVSVQISGRVATLTGTVNSADLRLIAETMVMMEPGVDSVRNHLNVASAK